MDSEISENKTQKTDFTQVPNEILNSNELSWGAKGLWAYMAGKPSGWKFTIRLMAKQCKDSVNSTTSKLNELLELGYVYRRVVMTKDGKKCFYSIYDEPNFEKPSMENPSLEKPSLENRILEYSNKDISNKELSNKENRRVSNKGRKIFQKPSVEEVQAYCEERGNNVDAEQFVDFYESKGWVVGKTGMKDWKAAVRTWERNGFDNRKVVKTDVLYKPKNGEDITYKRVFEFWKQCLGVEVKQTEANVLACKSLLDELGEDRLQGLIVALKMRSEHGYLTKELTGIKDFVGLDENKMVVQAFYDKHSKEWARWVKNQQLGKAKWEL